MWVNRYVESLGCAIIIYVQIIRSLPGLFFRRDKTGCGHLPRRGCAAVAFRGDHPRADRPLRRYLPRPRRVRRVGDRGRRTAAVSLRRLHAEIRRHVAVRSSQVQGERFQHLLHLF